MLEDMKSVALYLKGGLWYVMGEPLTFLVRKVEQLRAAYQSPAGVQLQRVAAHLWYVTVMGGFSLFFLAGFAYFQGTSLNGWRFHTSNYEGAVDYIFRFIVMDVMCSWMVLAIFMCLRWLRFCERYHVLDITSNRVYLRIVCRARLWMIASYASFGAILGVGSMQLQHDSYAARWYPHVQPILQSLDGGHFAVLAAVLTFAGWSRHRGILCLMRADRIVQAEGNRLLTSAGTYRTPDERRMMDRARSS